MNIRLGGHYEILVFLAGVFFLYWGFSFPVTSVPVIDQATNFFYNLFVQGSFGNLTHLVYGPIPMWLFGMNDLSDMSH